MTRETLLPLARQELSKGYQERSGRGGWAVSRKVSQVKAKGILNSSPRTALGTVVASSGHLSVAETDPLNQKLKQSVF